MQKHIAETVRPAGTITLKWHRDTAYHQAGTTTTEDLYADIQSGGAKCIAWGEGIFPVGNLVRRGFAEIAQ